MILHMQGSATESAGVCADCGAAANGNFCASCGADLRESALGFLGRTVAPVRRSFPVVYLKLLRAPIRQTVAFAEDPSYRSHVSFLLTSIAIFSLLMIPIMVRSVVPGQMSESLQTYVKVMSQVGVYVGSAITFVIAYWLYRYFAKERRTVSAYFKLYCLAFGFVMPLYAAYEFVACSVLGGIGMSSLEQVTQVEQLREPLTLASVSLALLLWAYMIAIHRRFWRMRLWPAAILYVVAAISSSMISFWLMFAVSAFGREALVAAGIVTI